jgi:hypothetical protein
MADCRFGFQGFYMPLGRSASRHPEDGGRHASMLMSISQPEQVPSETAARAISLQGKTSFDSESNALPETPSKLEVSTPAKIIERERRHESRIELLRRKASFGFLLTAVHSPRVASRTADFTHHHSAGGGSKKENRSEAGIQTSNH